MVKADRAHQESPTPSQIIVILNWHQGPKRLTPMVEYVERDWGYEYWLSHYRRRRDAP